MNIKLHYRLKKLMVCFLSMVMLMVTPGVNLFGYMEEVYAEDKVIATGCVTIGTTGVRVRTGPDTSSTDNIITQLNGGASLDILGEEFISNSYSWYYVGFYYDGKYTKGYIASEYVTVYSSVDYEDYKTFSEYLTKQGFPESYHNALIEIHAKYPNWIIKADITGLEWDYVVEQENVAGRSLVPSSFPSSTKSTAPGCYNWSTGEYTIWDSGGWVQASSQMVQYYLDPRNFLDETSIFMFENLSYNSQTQTEDGMKSVVNNTFLADEITGLSYKDVSYPTYISALIAAGSMSGVSPYHLASRIIQEMGAKGESGSISGTYEGYEGYYNYYNIGAYKTADATAIENGLKYAKKDDESSLRPWSTRMLAIIGGAKIIGKGYINAGQNTIYYEKFDLKNFYHQYMTNITATVSEAKIESKGYSDDMKSKTALVFNIPVYKNMPEENVAYPSGNGSPNNKLSALSIKGYDITPSFDMDTTGYDLIVNNSVSEITVDATTIDSKATVEGAGKLKLSVGENKVTVKVKAENGEVREYVITVVREEASSEDKTAGITTDYRLDEDNKIITGIGVGTTGKSFLDNITVSNDGMAKIIDADGNEIQEQSVSTGNKLVITNKDGNVSAEYTLAIIGDVNGDGEIDLLDIVKIKKLMLEGTEKEGAVGISADCNKDDTIDVLDIVSIKKHMLGTSYISQ